MIINKEKSRIWKKSYDQLANNNKVRHCISDFPKKSYFYHLLHNHVLGNLIFKIPNKTVNIKY
jgi:hypothetical protein